MIKWLQPWIDVFVCIRFNTSLQKFFTRGGDKNVANGNAAAGSELEDGKDSLDCNWDDLSVLTAAGSR